MKSLSLNTKTSDLFMIGRAYAKRLEKLNIFTAEDLIHHYPFRYNDFRLISKINKLQPGEVITIIGKIISFQNIFTKYGKRVQKVIVGDETGQVQVIFFNQFFLKQVLKPGLTISLSGKVDFFGKKLSLITPEFEIIKQTATSGQQEEKIKTIHTGRLVPVYPETDKVSSKWLRSRIKPLLENLALKIPDWLPPEVKKYNQLNDLSWSLQKIHFPDNQQQIYEAKKRLAFDELLLAFLQSQLRALKWRQNKVVQPLKVDRIKVGNFIKQLPFKLTNDQQKVLSEILSDLSKKTPMNRLLQGDVGCGKTIIAVIASLVAVQNNQQVAVMAPTEILAKQHYLTFKQFLEPLKINIGLVTGSQNNLTMKKFNNETINIIIGTHALIYDKVNFSRLGLVIIDEQHRFGVEQRAKLIKKGKTPHLLIMTATPIPRTVALTLYGDLNLSVINQMPQGRQLTKTWVVPPEKRLAAYNWIKEQIKNFKSQAFIVCPLIEPSLVDSLKNIKAAKEEFELLQKDIFPNLNLGILHGRLKSKEKDKVIAEFKRKKLDILVATPVIEVGLDIPQASIMVIEAADRFGLATLHQLRGRVGRRQQQAYCLLFASEKGKGYKRLKLMETSNNGRELAEMDLKFRGPGEIYGTSQHGFLKFKLASFNDVDLVNKTLKAAKWLVQKSAGQFKNFPLLKEKLKNYTIKEIEPN